MRVTIRIQKEPFDISAETAELAYDGVGAVASFTGHVRGSDGVNGLVLEHYPGMTERVIAEHIEEAARRWNLLGVAVIHRIGELMPGEAIVLTAVGAAHRGDALAAVHFLMDHLKIDATFWKQERRGADLTWVEPRTSDHHAAGKWK